MTNKGIMINNNTIQYLSPRETEVIARLAYEKTSIITKEQLDKYFGFTSAVRNKIIYRLNKRGILRSISKGIYLYSPLESGPAGSNINEFLIPPVLFPRGNYYIGYGVMYNYYGFIDQISQSMDILNTSVQRQKFINNMNFRMIKIPEKRMYGLEKIIIGGSEAIISSRERTLVDFIYNPGPAGGIMKAVDILKYQVKNKKVNIDKFIEYSARFPVVSARKIIGFVLEECGISDKKLYPVIKSVESSSLSTLFGAKSRKGKINNKWKVIIDALA